MAMSQQETFNWLLEEKRRLEEENTRLQRQVVEMALELAKYHVQPIIDKEKQCEVITSEVMDFRVKSDECAYCDKPMPHSHGHNNPI